MQIKCDSAAEGADSAQEEPKEGSSRICDGVGWRFVSNRHG